MNKTTYAVIKLRDGAYGVEITAPGASIPSVAAGFATEADAQEWVAAQKKRAPDASQRAKSIVDRVTRGD